MNQIPPLEEFKKKLGSDVRWALRAVEVLYQRQTAAEQATQSTRERNGVGFGGADAEILSSFAEQLARKGGTKMGASLSRKQLAVCFRELPKYAVQLRHVALEAAGAWPRLESRDDDGDLIR